MENREEYSPARKQLDPLRREDFEDSGKFEDACNQLRANFNKRFAKARAELATDLAEHCANFKKVHLPAPDPVNRARHYIHTYAIPCVKAILNTTAGLKGIRLQAEAEVA